MKTGDVYFPKWVAKNYDDETASDECDFYGLDVPLDDDTDIPCRTTEHGSKLKIGSIKRTNLNSVEVGPLVTEVGFTPNLFGGGNYTLRIKNDLKFGEPVIAAHKHLHVLEQASRDINSWLRKRHGNDGWTCNKCNCRSISRTHRYLTNDKCPCVSTESKFIKYNIMNAMTESSACRCVVAEVRDEQLKLYEKLKRRFEK